MQTKISLVSDFKFNLETWRKELSFHFDEMCTFEEKLEEVAEREYNKNALIPLERSVLMRLWAFNALTNVTWSYLYFYLQRPDWAVFEIVLLWLSIYLLIRHLNRYNKKAALMLWPYLAWVSFAGAVNVATVLLNRA